MSLAVPAVHGIFGTGIGEGLASGTSQDVPSSPNLSWDCQDWDSIGLASGTSRDVPSCPSLSWDCQDWDSRGLASGTSRDVPSSPSLYWDCQDLDFRGSSLWNLLGSPK